MPRTTEELLKVAEEVAEWRRTLHHKGRDILPVDDKFTSLIVEFSAKLREREQLIADIYKDLVSRAEPTDDGGKLLDLSRGLVEQIQDSLPTLPKKET